VSPTFSVHVVSQPTDATEPADGITPADRAARTIELLREAQHADEATVRRLHDEVILLNLEVAESVVSRYRNRGVPIEDLIQVGRLGLVKATRGFDPCKSDNFLGYAVPTILGEVKRFFRDNAWVVKPPRRIQELQSELSATSARLTHTTGTAPTIGELSSALAVDEGAVREALAADGCFAPSSLDRPARAGDEPGSTLADTLGTDEAGFDRAEALVTVAPLCRSLSERDRRIVYLRFFQEWTQSRIAEELGVTQMQVSRLLARILNQLRDQVGHLDGPESEPAGSATSEQLADV
jgi:RNA polymerase sigma-70 factor (sigma-B/F/G subfamily)